ncbi:MAG TPA: hypothetical protein VKC56_02480 [Gallionellaceae bacterium]|nr:hypothetical protein [Gallionellaceae bacterium]
MLSFIKQASNDAATQQVVLEGRDVRVRLSRAARQALAQRATPLVAEMELYFSCLIRLRVLFHETPGAREVTPVSDKLSICFRPVAGRRCDLHSVEGEQPLDDFPIVRRSPFVPHWLNLDYRKGAWVGEFGYQDAA